MKNFIYVLKQLGFLNTTKLLISHLISFNQYYVLNVNLKSFKSLNNTKYITGELQLAQQTDLDEINLKIKSLDPENKKELLARILFYKNGFKNCYIYRINNEIACMQWLIYPSENEIIEKYYKKKFYALTKNQVMVENVFVFPKFRGYGLFFSITCELLDMAEKKGYKSAICYIKQDRFSSLNEVIKLNFKITKLLSEKKILGYVWRNL